MSDIVKHLAGIPWKHKARDIITSSLGSVQKYIDDKAALTKEDTGFDDPAAVVINYAYASQTIALTGTFKAYWRNNVISVLTSGWVSDPHPNVTGHIYFLYYNGSTFVWADNTFPGFDMLLIAVAYYRTVAPFAVRECHGVQTWQCHQNDHYNIGTYRTGGGDITNIVPASTTADNRRPIISACTIWDEDLKTINAALTSKQYSQRFLTLTNTVNYTLASADIVPLTGNNPRYNFFDGAAYIQTPIPSNSVMTVWLYEVPVTSDSASQSIRHVFVQGQSYTQATSGSAGNLTTARNTEKAKTTLELNLGESAVISAEYVAITKFIIVYTSGNWYISDVIILSGNKFQQVGSPSGTFLSSVSTGAGLSGNGLVSDPLTNDFSTGASSVFQMPSTGYQYFPVTLNQDTIGDMRLKGSGQWERCTVANASLGGGTWVSANAPAALTTNKGSWNALTNSPTIVSATGTAGDWYTVGTAGTTAIDGIASWGVGDYIWFDGSTSTWQKINNQVGTSLTIGGSTTQIQYNNSGALAGSSNFVWDNTNKQLKLMNVTPSTAFAMDPPIVFQSGYQWNSTLGNRTFSGYTTVKTLLNNVTTPTSKYSVYLSANSGALAEKFYVTSDGLYVNNGGAQHNGSSLLAANSVYVRNTQASVNGTPRYSNKLYLAGRSWNSSVGDSEDLAGLQLVHVTENLNPVIIKMSFLLAPTGKAEAEYMSINSNGRAYIQTELGIGISSPADVLDVRKNQNATTNFFFRNTDTTDTSSRAFINVIAGGTTLTMGCLNAGDTYFAGTSGKTMYFQQSFGGAVNMEITSGGYIKLGATTAPAIKMKKLTGTTASTEGADVSVEHGIGTNKIISMTVKVIGSDGYGFFPEYSFTAGYQFSTYFNGSVVYVINHATNSENILSKPFVITLWYEE